MELKAVHEQVCKISDSRAQGPDDDDDDDYHRHHLFRLQVGAWEAQGGPQGRTQGVLRWPQDGPRWF
jgi:hypothetical protein